MPFDGQLSLFVALGCRYVPLLVARARFPDVNKMVSANAKVGLTLAATAFATYLFTIYTLKSQSPGDLNEMVWPYCYITILVFSDIHRLF